MAATDLVEGTVYTGPHLMATALAGDAGIGSSEMAKKAGLRDRIVPNTMHFAQLNDLLLGLIGTDWLAGGEIELKYRAPLYDGDELVAKVLVASSAVIPGGGLEFEVWCENQDGQRLARGTARWNPGAKAPCL